MLPSVLILSAKPVVFALSEGLTAEYLTVVVSNKIDLVESQQ